MGVGEGAEEGGMGGGQDETILVSVRLRPLNNKEIARNDVSDWDCVGKHTIVYNNANMSMPERSMYPTSYTFDRVFSRDCSTRQVYEEGAKEVALSVVTGINSSIFAYGQTSSGKTFTMTGITEYTLADIYDYIQKHTEREFFLKFSAMEIYNECVRDLLSNDSTQLRLLDDPERGTVVDKLTEETVRDWNHMMELLSICEAQRQIGETSLNETSSRSHQIIRLTIESSARELLGKDTSRTLVAAVNFVDLAGSERVSQSLAAGTRLKEGCHINRSLLTLGTVIRKLSKGRNGHIPFRDSKLTRILQSSLGGNSRTAIICTMSPARSHVEQSRNTLLFASCAKEVSTNAQVNVIVSDKALVKHLQRELARLESELRNPESTFVTSKFSALLREKELQIEKLEKQVKDLTLQLDAARYQVQDMVRLIGEERHSSTTVGFGYYPHLRVRRSPDVGDPVQEKSIVADSLSLGTSGRMSVRSEFSDSSFNDNYVKIGGALQDDYMDNDAPSRLLISSSQFSESDSSQDSDNDENSVGISEDACKEVRCIETEELSTNRCCESRCDTEGNTGISALVKVKDGDTEDKLGVSPSLQENHETFSVPLTEDRELVSHSVIVSKEIVTSPAKAGLVLASPQIEEARELSCIPSIIPSRGAPSTSYDLSNELSSSRRSLITIASRKPALLISVSSPLLENEGKSVCAPPNESKKEFLGRPWGSESTVSTLNNGDNVERLSREGSQSSLGTAIDIELDVEQQRTSTIENNSNADTTNEIMTNVDELEHDKQTSDTPANGADASDESMKRVKDVGLDPIEDCLRSPSNWPSEFKRLQREIIRLWHTCNVSLVHRSHFFLLFKGDSTDSIYMEVELRRLSFLKEAFSKGNVTVEDGRTLTPASSLKALRNERHMLCKQMQRQLSELERESLYLKWGVTLNGKNRRFQLVNRLWTDTEDMDHITNSAIVVTKLVGFIEPGQAFKEMFGLNFVPWSSKRNHWTKRISIL